MAYNTGKPVPSRDPRDLIDNAESFDIRATSRDVRSTPDRLGVSRKTWYGIEQDFAEFLVGSGFEPVHLTYQAGVGLQVDRPTQLIDYSGSVYRVKMPASFPVMLSGMWATDSALLVQSQDQSLRQDLADSTDPAKGAELVGFKLNALSSVGRSLSEKLHETVSVRDFGATGVGDDTAAIQAAVDHAMSTGRWLTGEGQAYYAGGIVFGSGLKLRDITIVNNKNADLVSVMQTEDTLAVTNVQMHGVTLDGNRQTQTGVKSQTTREDGGRHALAIRGYCADLSFTSCRFINSAGDGVLLFPVDTVEQFAVRNVRFDGCEFTGNRRHGVSADKVYGLYFTNCQLNYNGLDKDSGFPGDHGNTGDKVAGSYYGNGIDIEDYYPNTGSTVVAFTNCQGLNNARGGILILRTGDSIPSDVFGNYLIIGGEYNKGQFPSSGSSIEITPNTNAPSGVMFSGVELSGVNLLDGNFILRAGIGRVTGIQSFLSANVISALELAEITTDAPAALTIAALSGKILLIPRVPTDWTIGDAGTARGLASNTTYTDEVVIGQAFGCRYSKRMLDLSGNVRGAYRFEQYGEGPMRFVVGGGVGGTDSDFLTASLSFVTPGETDNTNSLGLPSNRWSVVYAGTGAISTSDGREKQQVRELLDAERSVAARLKRLIRAFKFNDAVATKGDGARIHFGWIAQDVKAAFEEEGLVAEEYAVLCYDEWTEQQEVRDEHGKLLQEHRPAGSRYGVRYEELLAFVLAVD